MKIAVTHEKGEIFGHFGHTKQFKVYETENGKIISWNDPRTARERSKTFPGIAKAMAEQWAGRCSE